MDVYEIIRTIGSGNFGQVGRAYIIHINSLGVPGKAQKGGEELRNQESENKGHVRQRQREHRE